MLQQVPFAPEIPPLPDHLRPLARAAEERAAMLGDPAFAGRVAGFVMSDPRIAWGIVSSLRGVDGVRDDSFCEWGCGIGLVTCLAAQAGWQARGIELEPGLVAEGQALAKAHGIAAELSVGSYKPAGFFDGPPPVPALPEAAPGLCDAAVTYVYGWPAEAEAVLRFFGRAAPTGALLLLYRGGLEMSLWRQD
ncbi:class I SAM-dependent methyltransferase [Oceaniglobus trochenteri]|uniref:class I SAM-dependent methyltransferase n=1 Tax=Oceaniglobus trochenteri TaxID=2763260 RepID=UPI001CFFD0E0|nr:class I SAM-dependent methyltransferase [Oceaniglobus trochenteri]